MEKLVRKVPDVESDSDNEEMDVRSKSDQSLTPTQSGTKKSARGNSVVKPIFVSSSKDSPEDELLRIQAGIKALELRLLQAAQAEANNHSVGDEIQ